MQSLIDMDDDMYELLYSEVYGDSGVDSQEAEYALAMDLTWALTPEAEAALAGLAVNKQDNFQSGGVDEDGYAILYDPFITIYSDDVTALEKALVGKNVYTLTLSRDGETVMTIYYKLERFRHAPVLSGNVPDYQTVYYTPGKPVTLTLPSVPEIGGSDPLIYEWYGEDKDGNDRIVERTRKPSLTITDLTADDHGMLVEWCSSPDDGVHQGEIGDDFYFTYGAPTFILLNAQTQPVLIPGMGDTELYYQLFRDQKLTLTVPPASGDPNKTIVYRWQKITFTDTEVIETTGPSLTITGDGSAEDVQYHCLAGYKGDDESFLPYGSSFYVTMNAKRLVSESKEIKQVEENLQNVIQDQHGQTVETPEQLKALLEDEMEGATGQPVIQGNSTLIDVQVSVIEGGVKREASDEDFGWNGIDVLIPYAQAGIPADYLNYDYTVTHMFEKDGQNGAAGAIDHPKVIRKDRDGLVVRMMGASPVLIAWTPLPVSVSVAPPPQTGDDMPIALLCMALALSLAGMALAGKSRKA